MSPFIKMCLSLFVVLLFCTEGQSQEASRIQSLIRLLKQANSDTVLVIAHRGDWRHAPENSLRSIQNCIDMGVDMVEIDIRMTKDSQLVLMHDATIDRTTTGTGRVSDWTLDSLRTLYLRNGTGRATYHQIPTLEEAMQVAKGNILVNLDKCYDYFDLAYEILERTQTTNHVVMKGTVKAAEVQAQFGEYLDQVFFMPIVDINGAEAAQTIDDYLSGVPPVAFELLFSDERSDLLAGFPAIREAGSRVWVNSLWKSLNAGYEDERAVDDPDGTYGWLLEKGVNMIQTDRPQLLLNYLRAVGRH